MKGLIGKKIGMTQVYDETGILIPVTVVSAGPCKVIGVKTKERDGYAAVQVGFGDKKKNNVTKAIRGQVEKAGITGWYPACIREFRIDEGESWSEPVDITNVFEEFRSQYNWEVIASGPGHGICCSDHARQKNRNAKAGKQR